ncbi:MAG TPA: hypothetical protein VEB20_24880 [Azospirillaceae bacterium]|nr:hypothetical protein [Azospirillaceae bacterium]
MTEVSIVRLNVLRAAYLLVGLGLAVTIWPRLLSHGPDWPLMNSVVAALLGGVSVLALLGLRYPLQMLPVLLFELVWKSIWLSLVAAPLWLAGQMDERTMGTVTDCLVTVVILPAIPWGYVVATYVKAPGAPWRGAVANRGRGPAVAAEP